MYNFGVISNYKFFKIKKLKKKKNKNNKTQWVGSDITYVIKEYILPTCKLSRKINVRFTSNLTRCHESKLPYRFHGYLVLNDRWRVRFQFMQHIYIYIHDIYKWYIYISFKVINQWYYYIYLKYFLFYPFTINIITSINLI